ncbi:glycine cleavage system aminomethyltransferase GcvT, partial [Acinetobacter baumannii]|nr:glycine cleavage system aminomethyltransferase GcvT [Acinetobacter baumannii]
VHLARLPAGVTGQVDVEIRDKRLPAQVVRPPFVRSGKAVFKPL